MAQFGCGGSRCTCVVTAGPGVTVTGNGSSGAPYVIGAGGGGTVTCDQVRPCLSAGPGIDYDPATGVIEAQISTDAGNTTIIGGDGGLYTPASSTAVQAADTDTVDTSVSGTGTTGGPYTVSAAVRLDPTPPAGGTNLIGSGPEGLYLECADVRGCLSAGDGVAYDPTTGEIAARPSTDAGNNLAIGGDGGLYVPPAAALTAGCGLTGDGSAGAPLEAAVGAWPYACDPEDNGGVIVCGSDGVLRGEPRSRAQFSSRFYDQDFANVAVPAAANTFITRVEFPFTNPDPCREAQIVLSLELEVTLNLPVGAQAEYGFSGPDEMVLYRNTGTTAANGLHWQVTKVLGGGIAPPGATLNLGFDVLMSRGTAGATYSHIQGIVRALFITR
ncbi:hypothetical protein [Streptomyces sp. KR55]|uniref:hypothetical protein n=1 Tax=Streptomyces sp. KR55 TaxID=3457425 RepID=UPI003FD362D6